MSDFFHLLSSAPSMLRPNCCFSSIRCFMERLTHTPVVERLVHGCSVDNDLASQSSVVKSLWHLSGSD